MWEDEGEALHYVPPQEVRGTALSLYSWGVYIGYSLAFAFNFIVEQDGWRWAFKIASFPGFLISSLVLFTVKEPKRGHQEHNEHHKIAKVRHFPSS